MIWNTIDQVLASSLSMDHFLCCVISLRLCFMKSFQTKRTFNWFHPFLRYHKNLLSLAIVVPQPTWKTYQRLGGGKVNMHWVGLGQFFSAGKSQSLGPEIQGVSRKSYPHNAAGAMVLVQSPEAGTPWAWKMFFWSFPTKTKQDQALPSHVQR